MAIKQTDRKFSLGAEQIDLASEQVSDFLCELKLERRAVMRIRLNAENILIAWQERFGAESTVQMSCYV